MPDTKHTILIVDDEENVLAALRRLFRSEGYKIMTATSPMAALQMMETEPADLVISDNSMPQMSGIELLREIRERWPDTIRIMLTGYADLDAAMGAINGGEVYRFATKPWNAAGLKSMVRDGLNHFRIVQENWRMQALIKRQNERLSRWNESLQEQVQKSTQELHERNEELERLYRQLKNIFINTTDAIAAALAARDPYTASHQRRVRSIACGVADEMGLSGEQVDALKLAAVIHDLGKIAVPSEILNKPGRLSDLEFSIIKTHPQVAFDILKTVEFPWPIAQIIYQHHERMDGSGYPQGLSGDEILLEARILAVSDVVEAMSAHRPYRPALGLDNALDELRCNQGRLYDSRVVEALLKLVSREGEKILAE